MPTSAKLLAEMKLLHPQLIDLSLGRVERLLGKLGDPHNEAAAGRARRRHQRQGLGHRLSQGDTRGRRRARARLHLAAPRALPRAHRARGRERQGGADRRGDAGRRADAHAGDQRQRRRHPVRDHDRGGVSRLRRATGRRAAARGRPRRPARCHQRRRASRARRHHADLARPCGKAGRHACRRSPSRKPASCAAACRQ